ncbi:MAG: Ig-like domain-containing protein [Segetibacter sp.]
MLTSNVTPCATGNPATSNSITETVNAIQPVSVSIAASATTICSGTSVTFTATPTNGGTTPSYQWKVNGTNAGTNSATFTTTSLVNNDVVTVILTSNVTPCASGNPATSNAITEIVSPNATIALSSAKGTDAQTICLNRSITNIKYTIGGGTNAIVTGLPGGVTGFYSAGTFTISGTPNASGVYTYTVTATGGCANPTATGSIRVNAPFTPNITASPTGAVCAGTSVTLSATGYDSVDYIPGGNFSTGNPLGWSGASANNSNGGTNSNWGEANGGKTYGQTVYDNSNTPSKGKFMIVDGLTDNTTKTASLSTPTFSTVGMTSATISWYQAYNFNGSANGLAELSLDGGSTYTTLDTYTASTQSTNGGNPNGGFVKVTFDLNNYLERTNLKIRWTYNGTANSNWAIDDVVIGGPKLPITYGWGSAGSGQSITVSPTQTTTYTVTANTTNGCAPTTKDITITVNPLPTATISGTTAVCQNATRPAITFTGTGGTAPYTFTYKIGTGANQTVVSGSGTNPVSVTVFAPTTTVGTFTYNLVSVQGQFCSNPQTGSATITVNPLPTITGTLVVCAGSTTQLTGSATAASSNSWVSSNPGVATVNNTGLVTGVATGTSVITYTNSSGCTITASVTVNAAPTITGTLAVCVGTTTN